MIIQPWKILETSYLQPGIRIDRCELPNGQILDCQLLEYADEVMILALTKKQEVVLIKQYRPGAQKVILEFPGGSVEEGERPLEGARRELMEETGYASDTLIEIGCGSPNPAIHTNKMYSFLAMDAEKTGEQGIYDDGAVDVVLMPLNDVVAMARNSELIHNLNITTLFFALAHLQ